MRLRRAMLGISQQRLAAEVGVSFQQVQKYERAANRISASKLHAIAGVLGVTVDYFYEGLGERPDAHDALDEVVVTALSTPDGVDLAAAFARIKSSRTRRQLVRLAQAISLLEDEPRLAERQAVN